MVIHNCLGKRWLETREHARPVGPSSKTWERLRLWNITKINTIIDFIPYAYISIFYVLLYLLLYSIRFFGTSFKPKLIASHFSVLKDKMYEYLMLFFKMRFLSFPPPSTTNGVEFDIGWRICKMLYISVFSINLHKNFVFFHIVIILFCTTQYL